MNVGAATLTAGGVVLHCDGRFAALVAETVDHVVGRPFVMFVSPEERASWEGLLAAGGVESCAGEFTLAGGALASLHLSAIADGPAVFVLVAVDLTEGKRREQLLLRSEAMRAAAERAGRAGSWTYSVAEGTAQWSPGVYELFDIDVPDTGAWGLEPLGGETGEVMRSRVHADDRGVSPGFLQDIPTEGVFEPFDFRVVRRDGSVRHLHCEGHVEIDASGAPRRVVGHLHDVTERVVVQAALEEREARLHALVDGAPDLLVQLDRDFRRVSSNTRFNRAAEAVLGWDPQSGVMPDVRRVPDCLVEKWLCWRDRACAGESFTDELVYVSAAGATYWDVRLAPVIVDGDIAGSVIAARDVTDRHEREAALVKLCAMRDLAETTGRFASWEVDLAAGTVSWSPGVLLLYDLDPGGLAGTLTVCDSDDMMRELLARVHPDDRERRLSITIAGRETGEYTASDFRVVHRDGSVHVIHSRGHVVVDAERRPVRVIGFDQDVSEQRRAEQEIRALNAELGQRVRQRTAQLEESNASLVKTAGELHHANRELESFSYSISHDLRAPLRAIDGFSEILIEDYAAVLDEAGLGHLERIRSGAQRMGLLIDDLLALSRVGRAKPVVSDVDLSLVAVGIIAELRRADPARLVEVSVQPGCCAVADEGLAGALLTNLLGNAWKFTAERAVAHISMGSLDADGETVFFVHDDGAGFDQSQADRLFTPFVRLHGEDEFAGSGIGLAIVQRVVTRHNGRCWAEGAVGEGATFYFTLAARRAAASGLAGASGARPGRRPQH